MDTIMNKRTQQFFTTLRYKLLPPPPQKSRSSETDVVCFGITILHFWTQKHLQGDFSYTIEQKQEYISVVISHSTNFPSTLPNCFKKIFAKEITLHSTRDEILWSFTNFSKFCYLNQNPYGITF